MLDIHFILANQKLIEESAKNKKVKLDLNALIQSYSNKKKLEKQLEEQRQQRNRITKMMDKSQEYIQQARDLKTQILELIKQYEQQQQIYDYWMKHVPGVPLECVPVGASEDYNVECRTWGELPQFDFKPKNHLQLGEQLDIIDMPTGAKVGGSKFYYLKNEGTLLDNAVLQFSYDRLLKKGFQPYVVPLLVKHDALYGTGYFPGNEVQTYCIEKDDLALVGTSEVSLCAYYQNKTLKSEQLPIKMVALSSCFRREAGTYGRQAQGLYRVHQFQKIEQVMIVPNDPKISMDAHRELLTNSEEILQAFQLPYRVVDICTGDLGLGQVFKQDLETWMPSREAYGETHSCSALHDFQARRLNLCYIDGTKKQYAYTLNNTVIASPRILIPLLEINQQKDGRIRIPKVLWPYMHGIQEIVPKS